MKESESEKYLSGGSRWKCWRRGTTLKCASEMYGGKMSE